MEMPLKMDLMLSGQMYIIYCPCVCFVPMRTVQLHGWLFTSRCEELCISQTSLGLLDTKLSSIHSSKSVIGPVLDQWEGQHNEGLSVQTIACRGLAVVGLSSTQLYRNTSWAGSLLTQSRLYNVVTTLEITLVQRCAITL